MWKIGKFLGKFLIRGCLKFQISTVINFEDINSVMSDAYMFEE